MRGFKNPELGECFTDLRRIIYNFVRTHQGISKTPAEEAELNLDLGRNRLLNLIFFRPNSWFACQSVCFYRRSSNCPQIEDHY